MVRGSTEYVTGHLSERFPDYLGQVNPFATNSINVGYYQTREGSRVLNRFYETFKNGGDDWAELYPRILEAYNRDRDILQLEKDGWMDLLGGVIDSLSNEEVHGYAVESDLRKNLLDGISLRFPALVESDRSIQDLSITTGDLKQNVDGEINGLIEHPETVAAGSGFRDSILQSIKDIPETHQLDDGAPADLEAWVESVCGPIYSYDFQYLCDLRKDGTRQDGDGNDLLLENEQLVQDVATLAANFLYNARDEMEEDEDTRQQVPAYPMYQIWEEQVGGQ